MSERRASRDELILKTPLATAADLMSAISSDATLGMRKKQGLRNGINTICRGYGRPPESVSISDLRDGPAKLSPESCGVSVRTFANICSYMRRALFAYRKDVIDTRRLPMSPEWKELFSSVQDAHAVKSCGRFARWCTTSGAVPTMVTQDLADRFGADLGTRLETQNARAAIVSLCRGWNKAADMYSERWPQVRLAAPVVLQRDSLPIREIDADFVADLDRMLRSFGDRMLMPEGFSKPLEQRTLHEMRRIYLRMYSVARKALSNEHSLQSIRDLVAPSVMRAILEFYLAKFGNANTKSANKYAHFGVVAATHWVESSEADLKELRQYRRRTKFDATGMTEKNRAIVARFEDDECADRLLHIGDGASKCFLKSDNPSRRQALELQSAVAIELLIAAPVRPQNLASIVVGRHLIWQRRGTKYTTRLLFGADEVKNDQALEFILPNRVVRLLRIYIERALPLLAEPGNAHLFPGRGKGHKGPGLLSQQIASAALRATGARVTGHRFRHVVGFLFLQDNPTGQEIVRRFLGHRHIETTLAFYAGMEQARAIQLFHNHLHAKRIALKSRRAGRQKTQGRRLPKSLPT